MDNINKNVLPPFQRSNLNNVTFSKKSFRVLARLSDETLQIHRVNFSSFKTYLRYNKALFT